MSRVMSVWLLVAVLPICRSALRILCAPASQTAHCLYVKDLRVEMRSYFAVKPFGAWDFGIESLVGVVLNGENMCAMAVMPMGFTRSLRALQQKH